MRYLTIVYARPYRSRELTSPSGCCPFQATISPPMSNALRNVSIFQGTPSVTTAPTNSPSLRLAEQLPILYESVMQMSRFPSGCMLNVGRQMLVRLGRVQSRGIPYGGLYFPSKPFRMHTLYGDLVDNFTRYKGSTYLRWVYQSSVDT